MTGLTTAGQAVRIAGRHVRWSGVVTGIHPSGVADVRVTDPGDSFHGAGDVVTIDVDNPVIREC